MLKRNSNPNARLWWINLLGSLFSYYDGKQTLRADSIVVPDFDMDAEDRKDEYHYTFPNGDVIPCNDCVLEVLIDEYGNEYTRALVTEDFIYFCNFEEGDENGAYFMFRNGKDIWDLVSNNYFASEGFISSLANEKILFIHDTVTEALKEPETTEAIEDDITWFNLAAAIGYEAKEE